MDAVRRAPGVPRVTFHGISYGTLHAQAYAARHPGAVRAVFLDSTVTVDAEGWARWPVRSAAGLLDVVCERSRDCREPPGTASRTCARCTRTRSATSRAGSRTSTSACTPALNRDAPVPPGSALPDVPVLAVGGDFDTMRPREVAEAVRAFPRGSFLRIPFGAHSLTTGGSEVHACVRGVLRDFLAGRVSGCTAENHRVPGAFPRSYEDITDVPAAGLNGRRRRLLGGAFATAADAVARRNPLTAPPAASG